MVLAVGMGRYFYARAEMFKSADGAALAAAQEVDVQFVILSEAKNLCRRRRDPSLRSG